MFIFKKKIKGQVLPEKSNELTAKPPDLPDVNAKETLQTLPSKKSKKWWQISKLSPPKVSPPKISPPKVSPPEVSPPTGHEPIPVQAKHLETKSELPPPPWPFVRVGYPKWCRFYNYLLLITLMIFTLVYLITHNPIACLKRALCKWLSGDDFQHEASTECVSLNKQKPNKIKKCRKHKGNNIHFEEEQDDFDDMKLVKCCNSKTKVQVCKYIKSKPGKIITPSEQFEEFEDPETNQKKCKVNKGCATVEPKQTRIEVELLDKDDIYEILQE